MKNFFSLPLIFIRFMVITVTMGSVIHLQALMHTSDDAIFQALIVDKASSSRQKIDLIEQSDAANHGICHANNRTIVQQEEPSYYHTSTPDLKTTRLNSAQHSARKKPTLLTCIKKRIKKIRDSITRASRCRHIIGATMVLTGAGIGAYYLLKKNDGPATTQLMWAVANDHSEIVEQLIEAKADINAPQNALGITALMCARSDTMVKQLVNAKADLEIKDINGKTALMRTARYGNNIAVQQLINAQANPDARDKDGTTALTIATICDHPLVVQQLIDAKANLDMQGRHGFTALMCAQSSQTVQQLINAKANLEIENGQTVLMRAAADGDNTTVQQLLNAHANPDTQNSKGITALMWAAAQDQDTTIQQLLNAKANPEIREKDGYTALMLAKEKGHNQKIIRLLAQAEHTIPFNQ